MPVIFMKHTGSQIYFYMVIQFPCHNFSTQTLYRHSIFAYVLVNYFCHLPHILCTINISWHSCIHPNFTLPAWPE